MWIALGIIFWVVLIGYFVWVFSLDEERAFEHQRKNGRDLY